MSRAEHDKVYKCLTTGFQHNTTSNENDNKNSLPEIDLKLSFE